MDSPPRQYHGQPKPPKVRVRVGRAPRSGEGRPPRFPQLSALGVGGECLLPWVLDERGARNYTPMDQAVNAQRRRGRRFVIVPGHVGWTVTRTA